MTWRGTPGLLLGIALGAAASVLLPMAVLIKLVPDDAYFYLKTANNFALGLGSTFDGVNPTNGYHPLWFLILAALFWPAHPVGLTEPDHLLRVAVFAAVALWLATAWCVAAALRLIDPRTDLVSAGTAFALVSMLLLIEGHIGMESHLVCLLAAVYIWIKATEIVRQRQHVVGTAVVLALLALSRIDFLFTLVPVIILFEIWTCSPSARWKTARSLGGLVIAVSAAYFLINYLAFGHVMTVSATVRSSFPRPVLAENLLAFYELVNVGGLLDLRQDGSYAALRFLFPVAAYAVFCWFVFRRSPGRPHRLDLTLVACGVGATVFLLLNATFNTDSLFAWYTALPVFIASLMLLRTGLERRWIGWRTNVVLALLVCTYALRLHHTPWPPAYDFAHELRRITTVEDRIFQVDGSGMVGFFSGRRVINGDGLINSFEFSEHIRTRRLKEYLRAKSVDYWSSEIDYDDGNPDLGFEFSCRADHVVGRMRVPTTEEDGEWILCRVKPDLFGLIERTSADAERAE